MFYVILYLFFSICGITLVKSGGTNPTMMLNIAKIQLEFSWLSVLGILCYGVSFLIFMYILPKYDLSYITPLTTGLTQILLLAVAFIVFRENITATRVIGILTIVAGIYILNIK
jgi:multidrug transporter EmrE-like cation transporter